MKRYSLFVVVLIILFILQSACFAAAPAKKTRSKPDYEDNNIRLRLIRRSPKQIAAFYEGREFPKSAIQRLSQVCFIAAIIHNKTDDILWLDLNNWRFQRSSSTTPQPIARITRDYWKKQWQQDKVDKASQATFSWTLLPDVRDLRADEGVGGNITLPMQNAPFSIIARFERGKDKQKPALTVTLNKVRCKQDK